MGSGILSISATVAASAVINTQQVATIQTSPEITGVTTLVIPTGQTWVIIDLYILASAGAGTSDPQFRFIKNQVTNVGQSAPLSALIVTNNGRPILSPKLGFESQSQLQIYLITTVANDATADDIVAYAPIDKRY